jgi:tRNA dimethylallyltransferase
MGDRLPPLVVVVGPTGVGKTAVAIRLALALDGEIVSADSRQVYRGMDIGTAKPTPEELRQVRHHLVDFLDPDEALTLAEFQSLAYQAIDRITASGKLPLLVGGTGQYVRAVVEGWGIPRVPPQPALRAELESFADEHGAAALHTRLAEVDPDAARAIDYRNVRRVVRALEVYLVGGEPISRLQTRTPPPYRILQVGLTRPRESLYSRIDARIDHMLAGGLLEEVKKLVESGCGWGLPSMSSLGYAQFRDYLGGEATLEEAVASVKRETRRFIRHQSNWFRPDDPAIIWFDLDEVDFDAILSVVRGWLDVPGPVTGGSSPP